jgi:hypothetical protein
VLCLFVRKCLQTDDITFNCPVCTYKSSAYEEGFYAVLHITLVEVFLVFIIFLIHQLIGGELFLKTNKKFFLLGNASPVSQSIGALS